MYSGYGYLDPELHDGRACVVTSAFNNYLQDVKPCQRPTSCVISGNLTRKVSSVSESVAFKTKVISEITRDDVNRPHYVILEPVSGANISAVCGSSSYDKLSLSWFHPNRAIRNRGLNEEQNTRIHEN